VLLLLAGDTTALFLTHAFVRGARDDGWAGDAVAQALDRALPGGVLPTEQVVCAVLLALVVMNAYGAAARELSPERMTEEWRISAEVLADLLGEPCLTASVPGTTSPARCSSRGPRPGSPTASPSSHSSVPIASTAAGSLGGSR
jgi:hypothetical protein